MNYVFKETVLVSHVTAALKTCSPVLSEVIKCTTYAFCKQQNSAVDNQVASTRHKHDCGCSA